MERLAFLTPYWSGEAMMRVHLASIRRFYASAPILVSKRGGGREEMERYAAEFGVRHWLEECSYLDAHLRLLDRCPSEFVCILDHDAVLLASLDPLLTGLERGEYDLAGVEERIREAPGAPSRAKLRGWLRYAPGCVASNFLLFNWRTFEARFGLRGVIGTRMLGMHHFEFDYGIGQRLPRHHYLRPYHTIKYGLGNLLMDGETPLAWHQWYGSFRTRLAGEEPEAAGSRIDGTAGAAERGERAFLEDYPDLNLSGLTQAWDPDHTAEPPPVVETPAGPRGSVERVRRLIQTIRRWSRHGVRWFLHHAWVRLARWWKLR